MTVPIADICLVLEGTYPYVGGGVSSWVHQIIGGLPDLTFALLLISPDRKTEQSRRYELPPNVISFAEVFIHEVINDKGGKRHKSGKNSSWNLVKAFHGEQGCPRHTMANSMLDMMSHPTHPTMNVNDALFSRESWAFVLDRYKSLAEGTSFMDYFWTWRAVHAPLFQTLIAETPPARIYHTVSTGYAGLLGTIAKRRSGCPLILTEHGIYVRERAIDLARASWIYEEPVRLRLAQARGNPLRRMWMDFFVTLGEFTYNASDDIVTLFGGNVDLQHQLGADPAKTRVIPNGVKMDVYSPLYGARSGEPRNQRIGFVGRVVPIKDVKTLIKACGIVNRELPNTEFWIVGPTDEDELYFQECEQMVENLGITGLKFTGPQDVKKIYPEIDIMVLTSISEGQPLTLLECACAGVPAVATDVGSCRELLEGAGEADKALGPSGIITAVGAPEETAAALITILKDQGLWLRMSESGRRRIEASYQQRSVISAYRSLYEKYLPPRRYY
ncbi:MAG: DUF3492 domain-containing protein [Myxococcales bacterium]|nr:DUF3492 domain-containing protein [Myxococcales bacterium]